MRIGSHMTCGQVRIGFVSSSTPDWLEQKKFTRSEWPVKQTNDKLLAEVKKRKIDEETFCFQDINRVPLSL